MAYAPWSEKLKLQPYAKLPGSECKALGVASDDNAISKARDPG
jgi:hypothetical protein